MTVLQGAVYTAPSKNLQIQAEAGSQTDRQVNRQIARLSVLGKKRRRMVKSD